MLHLRSAFYNTPHSRSPGHPSFRNGLPNFLPRLSAAFTAPAFICSYGANSLLRAGFFFCGIACRTHPHKYQRFAPAGWHTWKGQGESFTSTLSRRTTALGEDGDPETTDTVIFDNSKNYNSPAKLRTRKRSLLIASHATKCLRLD